MAATIEDITEFLAKVPLFKELSDRHLRRIAKRIRERDYEADEVIVEQGQAGIGLYIMVRGEAIVKRQLLDGTEREVDRLHRTDFFGELSLLDEAPRTASVIAAENVKCLALLKLDFLEELDREPEMAIEMLKEMARRYRRMMARI
ncbi:cyclic nucleotide-binding domain-containing protein [Phototrophicus methaneseepsis]|uniref:Cyclic nucleotide-binding domain-containing protein n=1 Tax=Phototrophicus methaneseepsis TaxID=2710758 RepID=A0A7S8EA74_9CHLR|nr:cyclic nucleotide-binding domain-containing protein [Phototrophicus methaneseepsis]QPC83226.1 cyclic nucleotide-binding domain-containing protein [Phototrophicus methaneseepsis]